VAAALSVLGVLLTFGALYSAIDAVPIILNDGHIFGGIWGTSGAWRDGQFAVLCAIGAIACFRGVARLVAADLLGGFASSLAVDAQSVRRPKVLPAQMSFDVIDLEPSPWPGVLLMAVMWAFPTIVFVLRRQLPDGETTRGPLAIAQWILAVAAALYCLASARLFDPRPGGLVQIGVICLAPAAFLAALVVGVFGLIRKRRFRGVA